MSKLFFSVSFAEDFYQRLYVWVQLSKARTRPLPNLVSTDPPWETFKNSYVYRTKSSRFWLAIWRVCGESITVLEFAEFALILSGRLAFLHFSATLFGLHCFSVSS